MNPLHKALENIAAKEIRLGYRTVTLFSLETLDAGQIGYSKTEDGSSLCTDSPGGWRVNWIVVGYEDETGDPIFVDSNNPLLPAYTAAHGQGKWEPELLSTTFSGLISALMVVHAVSSNRGTPDALSSNPLYVSEAKIFVCVILTLYLN